MRVLSALFAAVALTGAASADTQSVEIPYFASDLKEPARVEILRREITRAASRVCDLRDARTAFERREALECTREAEARANDQLDRAVADAEGVIIVAGLR